MRATTIDDCSYLLRHLGFDRARSQAAIDVGGTELVNLDGEVRRNPLFETHPHLTLLDGGFNVSQLHTRADAVVDVLDDQSVQHLSGRFDYVYSFDTLEHVSDPAHFCSNLVSMAKPGGLIYVATVFDWPYHPSPEDYFRFSPTGLVLMFAAPYNPRASEVEVLWHGWGTDRRGVVLVARRRVTPVAAVDGAATVVASAMEQLPGRLRSLPLSQQLELKVQKLRALPNAERWPAVRRGLVRATASFMIWPVRLRRDTWMLTWPDMLSAQLRLGEFEVAERRFVERFVRPGMTVVDIGAHQGTYTVLMGRLVAPHGRVIAFEPSPREQFRLRLNVSLNRLHNVTLEGSAIGGQACRAPFYVVQGAETGFSSLRRPEELMPVDEIGTRVETLDAYVAQHQVRTIDFIKMDIEGGELDALVGARALLARVPRPVILCEVSDHRSARWGHSAAAVYDALVSQGFQWYALDSDGLVARDRSGPFHENLVAVPNERADEIMPLRRTAERRTAERRTAERRTAERRTAERRTAERRTAEHQVALRPTALHQRAAPDPRA